MKYWEKGRTIDYKSKPNKMVLALGKQGFSVACITTEVNRHLNAKMTECQVYYRLRQSGILLRDFRNGRGEIAKSIVQRVTLQLWKKKTA